MTLDTIKDAIAELPESDRQSLTAWINDFGYDAWDREMAADFSPGGRGMALVDRIKREVAEGKAQRIEERDRRPKS